MMRFTVLFLSLLFIANSLQAQRLKDIRIDSVYIRAEKRIGDIGVTKTVIDSLSLSEAMSGSMSEVLTKFTPVFVKSYGSGSAATVSFRGTAASHTSVEWNGIAVNNPMAGQVDFSLIPVWFVDDVELYHGGSSLQQGGNALGGMITFDSKARWDRNVYGSLVQTIGSFGSYQSFVSAGGGNRHVQLRVRYLYEQADNDFKYYNNAYPPFGMKRQTNAFARKNGVTADLFLRNKKSDVFSVSSWYNHSDREVPTTMSYQGLGRDERQDDKELRIAGKWNHYGMDYKSVLVVGYNGVTADYRLSNKTVSGDVLSHDSRSKINSMTSKYDLEWNLSSATVLKAGASVCWNGVDTYDQVSSSGYDKSRFEAAIWASVHHRFGKHLSAFALIREELADRDFSPVMPSVGLDYSPLKNDCLHITVNGTRNYHSPTLNDLYWMPGGNPDLKRERGYSTDLSAAYELRKGSFSLTSSATFFYSSIDNWILWRPGDYRYWTAENIKKVISKGVEVNGYGSYQSKNSSFKTGVRFNYSYTKSTNRSSMGEGDESVGKQLMYVPLHKMSVMFDAAYRGYYFYYVCNYLSERFTTSSNETTRHQLPGYAINNVTIGKKIGFKHNFFMDFEVKVNNLFDVDYQAILWRAMPKRNYQLLVKFNF